jgi:hypothetical protein
MCKDFPRIGNALSVVLGILGVMESDAKFCNANDMDMALIMKQILHCNLDRKLSRLSMVVPDSFERSCLNRHMTSCLNSAL